MAVVSWLQRVRDVAAGRESFHAFLDEVIAELHARKDDPEQINAFAHDLDHRRGRTWEAIETEPRRAEQTADADAADERV